MLLIPVSSREKIVRTMIGMAVLDGHANRLFEWYGALYPA